MTNDLRPRAETTLRDLCALLYPATAGHDVVVYAAGDGPWSARWRWAARVVDGRVVGETGALADGERARVLAWARREMVRDVASLAMTRQWSAHVLALLDGTKRDAPGRRATRGTEHTAGLAERAGLCVTREVWR